MQLLQFLMPYTMQKGTAVTKSTHAFGTVGLQHNCFTSQLCIMSSGGGT